jgi:putative endonuclease
MKPFFAYMLRCSDGSYYVGHTDDLEARLAQHADGTCGGHTSALRPVTLVWSVELDTRDEALATEMQVKRWTRAKKEALICGDWGRIRELSGPRAGPDTRKPFVVRQAHHERTFTKPPHERTLTKPPHERTLTKPPDERTFTKPPHERTFKEPDHALTDPPVRPDFAPPVRPDLAPPVRPDLAPPVRPELVEGRPATAEPRPAAANSVRPDLTPVRSGPTGITPVRPEPVEGRPAGSRNTDA